MKKVLVSLLLILIVVSCKENKKEINQDASEGNMPKTASVEKNYLPELQKVFDAHGGMEKWNNMNLFQFEMPKPNGSEKYTINLRNRKTKVESDNWKMGFDGEKVWMENPDSSYKGKAGFYYNLMFYFNAMPFVLGDNGISYTNVPSKELAGKNYEGIKIKYDSGVGNSSNDSYILYYDSETYKMQWLAYTATFGGEGKGKDYHYIKYDTWQEVNGLLMPEKLVWYDVKDGNPTEPKNEISFKNESLNQDEVNDSIFNKPDAAHYVN